MKTLEYFYACEEFANYGKIKDIDFTEELWYEPLNGDNRNLIIKSIDFEKAIVELGKLVDFGCDCCGSYYESDYYNLDQLASEGYLESLLDRLGEVLIHKTEVK